MVTFLERTFPGENSLEEQVLRQPYRVRTEIGDDLPRADNGDRYLPYALTATGEVVYAPSSAMRGWNDGSGLRRYSSSVSKERRRLTDAALGMHAHNPKFTRDAVNRVSDGLRLSLLKIYKQDKDATMAAVKREIGRYYFNTNKKNFGRIREVKVNTLSDRQVWDEIQKTLRTGTVDQKLSIHDTVGTKLLNILPQGVQTAYTEVGEWKHRHAGPHPVRRDKIREPWMNDPRQRGRVHHDVAEVRTGGVAPAGANVPDTHIERKRGADMFSRDPNRASSPGGDRYFNQLDRRNLIFGASISGTTGTLLRAGIAFGKLSGELLKQYLFAIVGYLVGGGMHTFHESMEVARRLGISYEYGKYEQSLPRSFVHSPEYVLWREEYYDVAVLGGTHWRYNNVAGESHGMGDIALLRTKQRLEETLKFRAPAPNPQPANPAALQHAEVMRHLTGGAV